MDKDFEVLENSSDVQLKAYGKNSEDLFMNSLKALAFVQNKESLDESPTIQRPIFIESMDPSGLLVDFLGEVLSLSDLNKEVYTEIVFNELTDSIIDAELRGIEIGEFDKEVKAVGYQSMDIREVEDGLEATVALEI